MGSGRRPSPPKLATWWSTGDPVPSRASWPQHLMLVVPQNLEPRYRRRLDHRVATAELAEIPITLTTLGPWHETRSLVHLSSQLVIYHVPWSRPLERTVSEARRLRIPVVFEACAPLHDADAATDPGITAGLAPADRLRPPTSAPPFCAPCVWQTMSLRVDRNWPPLWVHTSPVDPSSFRRGSIRLWPPTGAALNGSGESPGRHPAASDPPQLIGYDSYESRWDPHLGAVTDALATILARHPEAGLRIAGDPGSQTGWPAWATRSRSCPPRSSGSDFGT